MRVTDKFTFFYGSSECFSNWYKGTPFYWGGCHFQNSEQYMMFRKAQLFGDERAEDAILETPDPRSVKMLGRLVKGFNKAEWDSCAKPLIYDGLCCKFAQNRDILAQLLKTYPTTLVEASPHDTIWGIGLSEDDPRALDPAQWLGTNWLGEVLTDLRYDITPLFPEVFTLPKGNN